MAGAMYAKIAGAWEQVYPTPFNEASGGTEATISNYNGTGETWKTHTFTVSGTLTVTKSVQPFRVLLVGGASGASGGSGGGTSQANTSAGRGGNCGGFSEFEAILAEGANAVTVGAKSSGGAVNGDSSAATGSSIPGYSVDGGAAVTGRGPNKYENGGVGAGGPQVAGVGGPGVASSITGASVIYAAGGGGGNGNFQGTGEALGGSSPAGGKGGSWSVAPTSGTTPGSGGGGGIGGGRPGQDGIVVVAYRVA